MTTSEYEPRRRILLLANGEAASGPGRRLGALGAFLADRHTVSVRCRDLPADGFARPLSLLEPDAGTIGDLIRCGTLVIHAPVALSALPAAVARLTGKRLVVVVWEIRSDALRTPGGRLGRLTRRIHDWIERRIYAAAHKVLVPSADFAASPLLAPCAGRTLVMPVWPGAGERMLAPAPPRADDGTLRLAYSGPVDRMRNLAQTARILTKVQPRPITLDVCSPDPFPMAHDGPIPTRVTVAHHGDVPAPERPARVRAADAGLVSLSPDLKHPAMPAEIVSFVLAGVPVVYAGPAAPALREMLERFGVGICLERDAEGETDLHARLAAIRADFGPRQRAFLDAVRLDWTRLSGVF